MPRARPMDPDDRRAQLLAASRRVFTAQGYHRASVAHIIREAGVARGTFYNYFDSKRAVFQAVLEDVMDEVWAEVVPIDVAAPIPPQVRLNIAGILGVVTEPSVSRLLFTEAVGIDEQADEAVAGFYALAVARIQRALERGQAMGIVAPGDMRTMARCVMGLVKEPVFQGQLAGEPPDPDGLAVTLYGLLSGGLLATPLGKG